MTWRYNLHTPQRPWHFVMYAGVALTAYALLLNGPHDARWWVQLLMLGFIAPAEITVFDYWRRPQAEKLTPSWAIVMGLAGLVGLIAVLAASHPYSTHPVRAGVVLVICGLGPAWLVASGIQRLRIHRRETRT